MYKTKTETQINNWIKEKNQWKLRERKIRSTVVGGGNGYKEEKEEFIKKQRKFEMMKTKENKKENRKGKRRELKIGKEAKKC